MGKSYYKDKEILAINERYVDGYGWLNNEQYNTEMHKSENPANFFTLITQYNIKYKNPDETTGQMDIEIEDFWQNRTFIPAKCIQGVDLNENKHR